MGSLYVLLLNILIFGTVIVKTGRGEGFGVE